jgi:hypothetical protein
MKPTEIPKVKEIFKSKPELLNEPCVQDLLFFMMRDHETRSKQINDLLMQETEIMRCCMESEITVKGGYPCDVAVKKMMAIFEKYC